MELSPSFSLCFCLGFATTTAETYWHEAPVSVEGQMATLVLQGLVSEFLYIDTKKGDTTLSECKVMGILNVKN